MISPADALRVVLEHITVLEDTPDATNRPPLYGVSAEALHAALDLPAADVSRMDGYAVVAPAPKGAKLEVIGETPAGCPPLTGLALGQCVRLYTGSVLPSGANAVIEQESVTSDSEGGTITLGREVKPGDYVTTQGSVVRQGDELLPTGLPLGPAQIGLAAAVGRAPVAWVVPGVALFSTGRELVPFTTAPAPHQTRDSNTPALTAALESVGCRVANATLVDDQLDAITDALIAALEDSTVHALVTVGGVSVGDYDLVPEALRSVGADVHLHRLAVKPGKPFLFATTPAGKPIFGLPGNPLSALASFFEFVAPALRKMAHRPQPWLPSLRVTLATPAPGHAERQHLVLASVSQDEEGEWVAQPLPAAHSADLSAAARADGVVLVPQGLDELPEGATVRFHPWRPLW